MENLFKRKSLCFLIALLPALLLFSRTLSYEWTSMDEQWMIVQNTDFKSSPFKKSIAERYYRPLLELSFQLDHKMGAKDPKYWHRTNVFLHLLSIALLLQVLFELKVPSAFAAFLAALFGIHPLCTAAVTWIPGRNDILLAIFAFGSIYFLLRFQQKRNWMFVVLHIFFYFTALFTKENAIVLLLVYSTFALPAFRTKQKSIWLLLFLWFLGVAAYLFARHQVINQQAFSMDAIFTRSPSVIKAYLIYLGKTIFPFDLKVMPVLQNSTVLPGIFAFGLLILAYFKARILDYRLFLGGSLIFILLLFPSIVLASISGSGEHYEHRAYLSLAGCLIAVSQIRVNADQKFVRIAALLVLIAFATVTGIRMQVYKNEKSFLNAGLFETPGYYLFYQQKAEFLLKENKNDSALSMINTAIKLRPDVAKHYNTRGIINSLLKNFTAAAKDYSKAIDLTEYDDYYYLNRFICYYRLGDFHMAMKDLYYLKRKCASILPEKETQKVIDVWSAQLETFIRCFENKPECSLALVIAMRYQVIGLKDEARFYATKALQLDLAGKYSAALAELIGT